MRKAHFVILGGPYLDLGVGGNTTNGVNITGGSAGGTTVSTTDVGQKSTSFGLTFGIAGYI